MGKTEEQLKADLKRNEDIKKANEERKDHMARLRSSNEVLRLEDENLRLQRNIYENNMFFKRIEEQQMMATLAAHNNTTVEEIRKLSVPEINKLIVEYQREMEQKNAEKEKENQKKPEMKLNVPVGEKDETVVTEETAVTENQENNS